MRFSGIMPYLPLVIIDQLHCVRVAFFPPKDNSLLLVDPNAVKSCPIATQRFKPIARWRTQIHQLLSSVQDIQLDNRSALDVLGKAAHTVGAPSMIEVGCPIIAE
jgi:hypothetical protein